MTTSTDARVLRGAVRAAVLTEGARLGITPATADDVGRRLLADFEPQLTVTGRIHLSSGESMTDALTRIATDAPHLFGEAEPEDDAQAKATERARLAALRPGDRLAQANGEGGLTPLWVRSSAGRPQ